MSNMNLAKIMSMKSVFVPNSSLQCLGMPGVKQQLMVLKRGAIAFDWFGHKDCGKWGVLLQTSTEIACGNMHDNRCI